MKVMSSIYICYVRDVFAECVYLMSISMAVSVMSKMSLMTDFCVRDGLDDRLAYVLEVLMNVTSVMSSMPLALFLSLKKHPAPSV
jgi:hypothetical protein